MNGNYEKAVNDMIRISSMRNFVFLVGTDEEAIKCAEELSRKTGKTLWIVPNGIQDTINDIYGFIDLKNNYHPTKLVEACQNGDIILITNIEKSARNILGNIFSIIDHNKYHKGSTLGFKPRTKENAMFPPDMVCDANNMILPQGDYTPKEGFFMIASTTKMNEVDILLKDRGMAIKL